MADDARLRVSVVQTESSLDPAVNRARLDEAAELAPASDLVRLPRGVRPRLRQARLRPGGLRRAARRPLRHAAARGVRPARRGGAGRHVRAVRRRRPALQHPGPRRPRCAHDVPQDPPLRLVRLPRVRHLGRRCHRAGRGRRARRAGRADDLLRPAVPRARPGARGRGRPGARRPRSLGRRRAQGKALDHAPAGPGDREPRVRRRRRPVRSPLHGTLARGLAVRRRDRGGRQQRDRAARVARPGRGRDGTGGQPVAGQPAGSDPVSSRSRPDPRAPR